MDTDSGIMGITDTGLTNIIKRRTAIIPIRVQTDRREAKDAAKRATRCAF